MKRLKERRQSSCKLTCAGSETSCQPARADPNVIAQAAYQVRARHRSTAVRRKSGGMGLVKLAVVRIVEVTHVFGRPKALLPQSERPPQPFFVVLAVADRWKREFAAVQHSLGRLDIRNQPLCPANAIVISNQRQSARFPGQKQLLASHIRLGRVESPNITGLALCRGSQTDAKDVSHARRYPCR